MKKIINEEQNKWKIVLVKTIENMEPIYYKLVNLVSYDVVTIPAYRIFDAVFNDGMNIINLKCNNNKAVILNSDGYESTDEIIVIDEFDNETPNIWDWCLQNGDIGNNILSKYDSEKNPFSPENFSIASNKKIAWTCEKNHTIHCDFSTYFSTFGKCPICEAEERGEIPSLSYWANITDNKEILNMYDAASNNTVLSTKISYKTDKMVWFRDVETDKEVIAKLSDITLGKSKLPFSKKKNEVNLRK